MKHTITLAAAAALAVGAASAHAGCADPRDTQVASVHQIPAYAIANLRARAEASAPADSGDAAQTAAQNIVGTWLVSYTVKGMPAGQALIEWHSDGTEIENINRPVLSGNMCLGAWKPVDALHVSRFHMGWLYTDGNLSGYFNETEMVRAASSHYVGDADFKIFDLNGNVQAEFTERSDAVRLAP